MLSRSRAARRLARLDQEVVLPSRWSIALAAALAAACGTVTAAPAAASCGPSGYAYAGVQPARNGHGIAAVLTALATPVVESGHVAGWVGVGGPSEGPGGTPEWIQVGLNSLPGTGNKLYYEVMRPGVGASYAEVATDVPTGRPVRVAVLEAAGAPGAWRVWVDGRAVTPAIQLSSGDALTPMAMGESWDGGRPACNRYSYRFQNVSLAAVPGGSWQLARNAAVLQDPGYRVVQRAAASFDASATRPLPVQPAASAPQPAAAQPAASASPTASPAVARPAARVQVVTARPVAADAPLRKGSVPAPSAAALAGPAPQPAAPAPAAPQPATPQPAATVQAEPASAAIADSSLGIGAAGSALLPGEQTETQ